MKQQGFSPHLKAFHRASMEHHVAMAKAHDAISETHRELAAHHEDDPTLNKLHSDLAENHDALAKLHAERAEFHGRLHSDLDAGGTGADDGLPVVGREGRRGEGFYGHGNDLDGPVRRAAGVVPDGVHLALPDARLVGRPGGPPVPDASGVDGDLMEKLVGR